MKSKLAVCIGALMAALVLVFGFVPVRSIFAETECVEIEDEEIPLSGVQQDENGNTAVILAGASCVMTIGAVFLWLRSERKRVVEEEE